MQKWPCHPVLVWCGGKMCQENELSVWDSIKLYAVGSRAISRHNRRKVDLLDVFSADVMEYGYDHNVVLLW